MLTAPSKTYKPFLYGWAFDLTQEHEIELHWHEKEVNLQQDIQQWKDGTLTEQEKDFITNVLRLFTQSDVSVGESYKQVLVPNFKNNEVSNMLTSFANREGVHQRAYALIPESLGFDDSEWHAFLEYSHMVKKWEMMQEREVNNLSDLAFVLAKTAMMEGVSLFGSFAMLLQFKQQAKMLGMCEVVEWSIRDETIHVRGNAQLFREFLSEHPRIDKGALSTRVARLVRGLVKAEHKFIKQAYSLLEEHGNTDGVRTGTAAEEVMEFIEYLADRRLIQLGLDPIYKRKEVPEKMRWFEEITLSPRDANFFERRVTDYVDQGMVGALDWGAYTRLSSTGLSSNAAEDSDIGVGSEEDAGATEGN